MNEKERGEGFEIPYIFQNQYGLIAPACDTSGVARIATAGLNTCFAFALFDMVEKVGGLAHMHELEVDTQIQLMIEKLEELGGKRFQMATVHLKDARVLPQHRDRRIEALQRQARQLVARGMLVVPRRSEELFTDHRKTGEVVVLDARKGLQLLRSPLDLNYSQTRRREIANHIVSREFTCGYEPRRKIE